ncbi:MAG: hypothetical protein C5B50_29475 [Verrucomicrobia bacterium]|nr:MAG: hypothetical protein C5B50_29475 [Verrucomicrobiota bacterium]
MVLALLAAGEVAVGWLWWRRRSARSSSVRRDRRRGRPRPRGGGRPRLLFDANPICLCAFASLRLCVKSTWPYAFCRTILSGCRARLKAVSYVMRHLQYKS